MGMGEIPRYVGVRAGAFLPAIIAGSVLHAKSFTDGLGAALVAFLAMCVFWTVVWFGTAFILWLWRPRPLRKPERLHGRIVP